VSDLFLFGVFPYLAAALAVGGGIYRARALRNTFTARSSQLLEGRLLYWGSVPWHYAIVAILLAHVLATVLPGPWGRLLGSPGRLYAIEVLGLALGALSVLGIGMLLVRRLSLTATTSAAHWAVLLLLAVQAASGVYIAFALRWGSAWFLHGAAPWLASLARLQPRIDAVAALPLIVKVHAVNAFVLIALLPLTRLMHLVSLPISYLWRRPQVVIWQRAPGAREVGR
jgi:nitrate reductase gamma subunit